MISRHYNVIPYPLQRFRRSHKKYLNENKKEKKSIELCLDEHILRSKDEALKVD